MKKTNNKGFSLVELIVVIAIMAVLIGVLAPQFLKYVEQSRRSTDIQNADSLKTAVIAAIADGELTGSATATANGGSNTNDLKLSTVTEYPKIRANVTNNGGYFVVVYDAVAGTCSVYADTAHTTYNLTTDAGATAYKNYVASN